MNIIEDIIYPVLDQLKEDEGLEFENSEDLVLYGEEGTILDSLSIVEFLIEIKDRIYQVTGKNVVIASQKVLSDTDNLFKTVAHLRDYISNLLESA